MVCIKLFTFLWIFIAVRDNYRKCRTNSHFAFHLYTAFKHINKLLAYCKPEAAAMLHNIAAFRSDKRVIYFFQFFFRNSISGLWFFIATADAHIALRYLTPMGRGGLNELEQTAASSIISTGRCRPMRNTARGGAGRWVRDPNHSPRRVDTAKSAPDA